jgi:hypothetical protein
MPVLTTTGKNLFDKSKTLENCALEGTSNVVLKGWKDYFVSDYIPVKKNEPIFIPYTGSARKIYCDKNKEYVRQIINSDSYFTPEFDGFIRLTFLNVDLNTYQLEYNTQATSYEPHKSNILTTNEEVTLRGIGDVKDELNLLTGELTQRVGEIVLNGDESIAIAPEVSNDTHLYFNFTGVFVGAKNHGKLICDVFSHTPGIYGEKQTTEGITIGNKGWGSIRIKANKLSTQNVTGFKKWLSLNPITVQYQLATESVKTVDLTVTDQDGNTIPHIQTQPTVTHITSSSDYLIPTVTIDNNLAYDTIIKPSTLYTVRFKHDTVNTDNPLTVDLGGTTQEVTSTEFTITTPSTLTHNQLVFSGKNNVVSEVQVIEGDVTNIEYPFFEGMSDVRFTDMTRNVNLFDIKDTVSGFFNVNGGIESPDFGNLISNYIKVKPNTTYVYNHGGFVASFADYWTAIKFYKDDKGSTSTALQDTTGTVLDKNGKAYYIGGGRYTVTGKTGYNTFQFTTPSDCEYIRIGSRGLSYSGAWATLYQLDNFDDSKFIARNCPFIFGKGGRI